MATVKKIILVVLIIIAIPFIVALFVKKEYFIERQITINKPAAEVFNYIKFLKNQDNYSTWVRMDPSMKKDFKGTDGTVGFVYAWDGNKKAGKGEQEIKNLKEGELVDIEVRFIKPFEGVASVPISTEGTSANQTRVTWSMKGKNAYPFNFMNLFMGNMLGKDLDSSLVMLKGILEKS